MEEERLQADVVVHTTLINGLVESGRFEQAWEEFNSARTWKLIQPDEVLFTVMIKACAKSLEPERALNMLDDLRMCGLYPTDITYGELIHAMSTTADHAQKAFDFYRQMQAEEMPLSSFIFEKLLQACRVLGDPKRAREVVQEMQTLGFSLEPAMYYHLVGLFASAMRLPQVGHQERLQNLRCAWHVLSEARSQWAGDIDWTIMLNEVMGVYIAAGLHQFAIDMLQQYPAFGARPDDVTHQQLLEMLGCELKDVGRFFALWDVIPKTPKPADKLYHLALEMAMESRSAKKTVEIMEELYAAEVMPTPQLTERLAKTARHVAQIHLLVGKFLALNKTLKLQAIKRETARLQSRMDERDTLLAVEGKRSHDPTPEQEARKKNFEMLKKRGMLQRPWLPKGLQILNKQKGGEAFALRHDRPRPNLLTA